MKVAYESAPRMPASHRRAKPRTTGWQAWPPASLVLLAALTLVRAEWAAQVILIPLLLTVPGFLLLRALRVPGAAIASFPVYVPAASLVLLMGSGLAVDLLGPLAGVTEPLRPLPLLAGLEACCLILYLLGVRAGPRADIPWRQLARPIGSYWPLLLPVLAAAGALRLNSGHGGALALVALVAVVAAVLWGVVAAGRRSGSTSASLILYCASLALMLSFSLRGALVYGYDISSEYYAMQHTVQTGIWHTAHAGDAYGALLSVTVLPAQLHALSGLSGLLIFKAVYPLIGALIPLVVFHLGRRLLAPRWALVAGVVVLAQGTFFQELPGLARQEVSLVMFAVLVAVILDNALPRWPQLALTGLFALAMTLSHYSTTYFAIAMLAVALIAQLIVSWFREMPRISAPTALALLTSVACAALWYGLITRSASNLSGFLNAAEGRVNLLPSGGAGGMFTRYLQSGAPVTESAAAYARQVAAYYAAHMAWIHPLPAGSNPAYALQASTQPKPPMHFALGLSFVNSAGLVVQQLLNLAAAVGALMMILRRSSSPACRQIGLMGFGTLGVLAVLRLDGTAASVYNPQRALLQALVVLAIAICWLLQELSGVSARRYQSILAATLAALGLYVAGSSGLAGAVLGGGVKTNLADSGTDYEQFGMTPLELDAAGWLGAAAPSGQAVYSDRYGELRLFATIGPRPGMVTEITPETLSRGAWIYADQTNVTQRTGLAFFQNAFATYAFPFNYLNANYSLVYTNGVAEVYHR